MNHIHYMWNFKPNERHPFPKDAIDTNSKYISNYLIHTPDNINILIKNNIFPELEELYYQIPHWVIHVDLLRLLIIYFNGGFYCDADCFIQKKWKTTSMVVFTEYICKSVNELGLRECKNPENVVRIANYCFGTNTLHHPFLKEVIEECIVRLKYIISEKNIKISRKDILWICGPDVITTVYHRSKHKYDISLYDKTYLQHMQYASWR
uniref:Glycosyltransferase n=1 Tax=viral metagenome TaxID=1070528 RepID=A0A6C0BA42_9ZZZZ